MPHISIRAISKCVSPILEKVLAIAEMNPEALNDGCQNGSFWYAIIQEDVGVDCQEADNITDKEDITIGNYKTVYY
jgi:hypothetical protein